MTTRVPVPRVLDTVISPPHASTRLRLIARPSPLPLVRVEKCGSKIFGSTSSGMPTPSSPTTISTRPSVLHDVDVDVTRVRESRVLEHVEQHLAQLIAARDRDRAVVRAGDAPRHFALAHSLELDDVAHDRRRRRSPCPAGALLGAVPYRLNARAISSSRSISDRMRPTF